MMLINHDDVGIIPNYLEPKTKTTELKMLVSLN